MCTAATYKTKDFYFGRTLDYEFSYGDEVTVTPRNFCFRFRHMGEVKTHYAMIGMAYVADDYPLYYDAVNEKGLGMAGLNFVGNAKYQDVQAGRENVAQFEFIPWILSQCATVLEARKALEKMNLVGTPYSEKLPCASLHWMIADKDAAIVVECVEDGLHVYDNPVGVLTNNPPFDMQGGLGLPGDLSSASRFAKVAFTKMHAISGESEAESVSQFFHILGSVEQQRGCCEVEPGKYEITIYTSCVNADKGIYYYTTYENHQIQAVDMHREDLDGSTLRRYPLINEEQIHVVN